MDIEQGKRAVTGVERPRIRWYNRLFYYFKVFCIRVLVHSIAVLLAGYLSNKVTDPVLKNSVLIWVYFGAICLWARGMSNSLTWHVPVWFGWIALIILNLAGYPSYASILWGGTLAWALRLEIKGWRRMGTEWIVAPFLLASLWKYAEIFGTRPAALLLSANVAAYGVACMLYPKILFYFETRDDSSEEAGEAAQEEPAVPQGNSRSFHAAIERLLDMQRLVPQKMRPVIRAISASAQDILRCMEEDPRALEPGKKFLDRYLPATHLLLSKYIKLAHNKNLTPEIAATLAKSEEVLARVRDAFTKEHTHLLQNDVMDFSAELGVLDTMLKMRGS